MSILGRIRANGGDIVRDEWRFSLKPGRLKPDAIAWIKRNWTDACSEAWPEFDRWIERAAIMEFEAGMARREAEAAAYEDIMRHSNAYIDAA
ncbi:hypothetical protein FHS82_001027 [Pseudochelatococcus lubricantis]|uniref:Uncharacterized protein n=1 Tax=Pseudochelatococcus lubricantis TaxID=1538102 RepID=A0ABX0V2A8_9HYPH|nr:hypothetical protein [Pseudochelatococcus lubricantis]NIJ57201.1 hypothetical protein [Pseudochelatococcus lubricantis]